MDRESFLIRLDCLGLVQSNYHDAHEEHQRNPKRTLTIMNAPIRGHSATIFGWEKTTARRLEGMVHGGAVWMIVRNDVALNCFGPSRPPTALDIINHFDFRWSSEPKPRRSTVSWRLILW